jgi:hypothetical protein
VEIKCLVCLVPKGSSPELEYINLVHSESALAQFVVIYSTTFTSRSTKAMHQCNPRPMRTHLVRGKSALGLGSVTVRQSQLPSNMRRTQQVLALGPQTSAPNCSKSNSRLRKKLALCAPPQNSFGM